VQAPDLQWRKQMAHFSSLNDFPDYLRTSQAMNIFACFAISCRAGASLQSEIKKARQAGLLKENKFDAQSFCNSASD
jgi:hypothetical protein